MNAETLSIVKNRYGNNFENGWRSMPTYRRKRFENHIKDVWCF